MQTFLEKDKNLNEIVEKLKIHFKPLKLYLFGSRSQGIENSESDYDLLLVIKESNRTKIERMQEANQVLWGRTVSVDVFIYTEAEFDSLKQEVNSIASTAFNEGIEL